MIIRSKAPLRIGFAGGGTDVSPYCDLHGGAILNATIRRYAYASIIPLDNGEIVLKAIDRDLTLTYKAAALLPTDGQLDLHKGVYNRIVKDFSLSNLSFELSTFVDAPPGSGLGSSSTLVVSILSAFAEWLSLPLGDYDIAHLAYEIERIDLGMTGGRQDQYAATFGGVNFMEFYEGDKVIVNPLRIKQTWLNELDNNILLYYTGTSRLSEDIINSQVKNVHDNQNISINAMHKLKEQAIMFKEALLKGKIDDIGPILDFGWKYKKEMAKEISNPAIDQIYDVALKSGATGGKISGAGGGGFFIFYCPENNRYKVIEQLTKFGGEFRRFSFNQEGVTTWTIK